MDVTQLPQEVQDALPQRNDYSGANAGAVIPGTSMPLPPNAAANASAAAPAPEAPDIPYNPGSLADKISQAWLSHIAARQPAAPSSSEEGQRRSRAQQAVAATQGVMTALGDAAHAHDHPGGWLSGIANTLAARDQRMTAAEQQEFNQQQEKRKNDALIARNQAETVALQRNIFRQDQEMRQQSYARGSANVETLRKNYDVEQEAVSQSALGGLIKKNPNYLNTHYVFPTGEEPVLDGDGKPKVDSNGNPVMSPLYALVSRTPREGSQNEIEISPEFSADLKKYKGINIPAGTKANVDQFKSWATDISQMENVVSQLNKGRSEVLSEDLQRQLSTFLEDPGIQHYVAMVPGRPLAGLYQASQNATDHITAIQQQIDAAKQKGDQAALQKLQGDLQNVQLEKQKVDQVIAQGFSTADKEKYNDELERARHDAAEEALADRRADIQAHKQTQDKQLGDSYKTENKELDTVRKPLSTQLASFSTLRSSLDQGTAAGDSVVAPALLKALVAGGGVRITQAEINNFTHGRSSLEEIKGVLQKMSNGKSITPEQRKQVYSLLGAVETKAKMKEQALEDAQDALDGAQTVDAQRKAVSELSKKLAAIDGGQPVTPAPATSTQTGNAGSSATQPAQSSDPFAQFGGKAH